MDQVTIMRRADGELFTLTAKGQTRVALWPSLESATRYKYRNPGLLVFKPASAASPFGQKSLKGLRTEGAGLFLLIDAGGAHFSDGQAISWEELENRLSSSPSLSTDSTPSIDRPSDGDRQNLLNNRRPPEELPAA